MPGQDLGQEVQLAGRRQGDAPLLALGDQGALAAVRSAERRVVSLPPSGEGPAAVIEALVEERRQALRACLAVPTSELVARWDLDGHVRFSADHADSDCVGRALGALRLQSPASAGSHRVVLRQN